MLDKEKKKKIHIIDVQPIRDLQQLEDMKWALKRFCGERDYILFLLGINTGLRVGDMLGLTVKELKNKKVVTIKEGKTDKPRKLYLENIYDELNSYIKTVNSPWLFPSRKGDKPLTNVQAWRQFNKAAEMAEIPSVGTHTMRKTFGYWYYKKTLDIVSLQKIFNHFSPAITLKYIGITDEEIENSLKDFLL